MEDTAAFSQFAALPANGELAELADFDAVVNRHWQRIFRFALASLRDQDAAQTLAQDCFLRAFRYRDRFRGDAALETWLLRIAINLIRDRTRDRRFQFWAHLRREPESTQLPGSQIDPEQTLLRSEQVAAVWDVTGSLPERQRTAFVLRYVEELDVLEIASVMDLSEGAVKTHLFRALRTVRQKLREDQ